MKRLLFLLTTFALSSLADVVPTVQWDVETGRLIPVPYALSIRRGESVNLEPRFLSYNSAMVLTGATIQLRYWYTGQTGYYATTGSLMSATGRVHIAWADAQCPASNALNYEVRATLGTNVLARGYGGLTLLAGTSGMATNGQVYQAINWSLLDQTGGRAILTNEVDGTTIIWTNGQLKAVSAIASETDPIWSAASNLYYRASNPSNFCTLAAAAALTNGLASTSYVAQVVGGYLPTNTAYVATEADTNALYQLGVHTNLGSGSLHVSGTETGLIHTAWQNPASATNWTWTKTATAVTLTGYSGPNAVVIPDMLDNLPVTNCGTVFRGTAITSVSGGSNIKILSQQAFENCTSLANFDMPSVTYLTAGALSAGTVLTNIVITSASYVGTFGFSSCPALLSLYFGGNAPAETLSVFAGSTNATIYVTSPTATGWGATWNGRPVVRLPLYGDGSNLTGITAAGVGASPTGHVHAAGDVTNLQSTVAGYGYLTNITPAQIVAAGGLTNIAVNGTTGTVSGGIASVTISGGSISMETTNRTISVSTNDSIQAAIDSISKFIKYPAEITVALAPGTHILPQTLDISSFYGGGTLLIQAAASETNALHTNQVTVINGSACTNYCVLMVGNQLRRTDIVDVRLDFDPGAGLANYGVGIDRCTRGGIVRCWINCASTAEVSRAVRVLWCNAYIEKTYITGSYYGIEANEGATVNSSVNDDFGTMPVIALYAEGSTIFCEGSQPDGSSYDSSSANGGLVLGNLSTLYVIGGGKLMTITTDGTNQINTFTATP